MGRLSALWKGLQVELRGRYSAERVIELEEYLRDKTWIRPVVLLVLTPLPCLLVTLVIDVIPLSDPALGIEGNKLFIVREYYAYCEMTFLTLCQFREGVRILPYPMLKLMRDAVIVAVGSVGIYYGLVLAIGFPLPFTTLTMVSLWATLTLVAVAIQWLRKALETPGSGTMLFGMCKIWICDIVLVFIYPPYFHLFSTLSSTGQMVFAVLLPGIKLFMRNLFSRAVTHLGDEMPTIVVFNADVFGSLFISYCMQSSPSVWTTLEVMVADIVMIKLALRDIESARSGLKALEQQVDHSNQWNNQQGHINLHGRIPTTLQRASILLQHRGEGKSTQASPFLELKPVSTKLQETQRGPSTIELERNENILFKTINVVYEAAHQAVRSVLDKDRVYPIANIRDSKQKTENVIVANGPSRTASVKTKYTQKVRRLLYMAEFLLLINYVEVIIPLVFSVYLIATYHLPNREYYAVYDGMDQHQLVETLSNVMFYCLLQFISLLVLVFVLKRTLDLSPIKLIGFVLEKEAAWVQMSLTFWVFYNSLAALQHSGYDYSFRFAWLSAPSTSDSSQSQ